MKHREFGKTGLKVSALGFGNHETAALDAGVTVDEKRSSSIIRHD